MCYFCGANGYELIVGDMSRYLHRMRINIFPLSPPSKLNGWPPDTTEMALEVCYYGYYIVIVKRHGVKICEMSYVQFPKVDVSLTNRLDMDFCLTHQMAA